MAEIQRLDMQQRDFLIKVLEACVTLKTHVETDLQNGWSHFPEINDAREILGKAKASLQLGEGPFDMYSLHAQLMLEKQKLQSKFQEMMLQCQLDDLIGNSGVVFDFNLLKQAVSSIHTGEPFVALQTRHQHTTAQNPILFLTNYCMSQLYSRHVVSKQQHQHLQNGTMDYHNTPTLMSTCQPPPPQIPAVHGAPAPANSIQSNATPREPTQPGSVVPQTVPPQPPPQLLIPPGSPSLVKPGTVVTPPNPIQLHAVNQQTPPNFLPEPPPNALTNNAGGLVQVHSPQPPLRAPSNLYPMYYFNIEVNGSPHGRIVIEVRPDVAPKMAKNFSVLATGEIGVGYKGCAIFQCWEGESVITGDFELNNGRGGRSIFEDGYFMPDDTKFPAVRGAVGMRRTQKRHDNLGMVGSQFRIILQEMRGFTGIFGHVVEGLDLVEQISTYGDQTGKPTKTILITKCGKL